MTTGFAGLWVRVVVNEARATKDALAVAEVLFRVKDVSMPV